MGDRKNTRVDQRILHLDVAAAALKLVRMLLQHDFWEDYWAYCSHDVVNCGVGTQELLCQTHKKNVHTLLIPQCVQHPPPHLLLRCARWQLLTDWCLPSYTQVRPQSQGLNGK